MIPLRPYEVVKTCWSSLRALLPVKHTHGIDHEDINFFFFYGRRILRLLQLVFTKVIKSYGNKQVQKKAITPSGGKVGAIDREYINVIRTPQKGVMYLHSYLHIPLHLYSGHFLSSPRWPLWRCSTVLL